MQLNSSLPIRFNSALVKAKTAQTAQPKEDSFQQEKNNFKQETSKVFSLSPNVDFIAADEKPNFFNQGFSAQAKKALQGYWQVAQSSFAASPRYVDVYA